MGERSGSSVSTGLDGLLRSAPALRSSLAPSAFAELLPWALGGPTYPQAAWELG